MAEKRSSFLAFLNVAPEAEGTYALIGDGVTELSVSYNPQTTTNQYIHQDVAQTDITGYQPNAPVTSQAVKGDKVYDYVNGLRKTLPVGPDAYSDVVLIETTEKKQATGYPAQKQPVAIQIDSFGGAASDPLSIGYTLNWRGESTDGFFDTETLKFSESGGV